MNKKVLNVIFKILKRITYSVLLIYSFNLIASPLNVIIPMNYITLTSISFFGIPALFSLISIYLIFF